MKVILTDEYPDHVKIRDALSYYLDDAEALLKTYKYTCCNGEAVDIVDKWIEVLKE